MKTKESQEMYLETILTLQNRKPNVRSIDIAEELGYSRASVSRAIHLLIDNQMIEMNSDGTIILTNKGRTTAENILERHTVLTNALIHLGISNESAEENACRIEHVITDDVFQKIKEYFAKK